MTWNLRSCALILLGLVITIPCVAFANAVPDATSVLDDILDAIQKNNVDSYRNAREQALKLPDAEFALLIENLSKLTGWRALAVRDGLKLRRNDPATAKDFDDRLKEIVEHPNMRRGGGWSYITSPDVDPDGKIRGLLETPEHDTLRFEAVLAVQGRRDAGDTSDSLRKSLLGGMTATDPANVDRQIKVLSDLPSWTTIGEVSSNLFVRARRNPGAIDVHVPRLLQVYRQIRQNPDERAFETARLLVLAIASASPELQNRTINELREFERERMAEQGLHPWDDNRDAIKQRRRELRNTIQQVRMDLNRAQEHDTPTIVEEHVDALTALNKQLEQCDEELAALALWEELETSIAESNAEPSVKDEN